MLVLKHLYKNLYQEKSFYLTHKLFKSISSNDSSIKNEVNQQEKMLHIPVLLNEVVKYLVEDEETKDFRVYLDLTFGAGGHSQAILNKKANSILYGSDRDVFAFNLAQKISSKYNTNDIQRLIPINSKFSDIQKVLKEMNVEANSIDAALIDCGCSSVQMDEGERGFSLSKDGPLDMRMGPTNDKSITAYDVVNKMDEESLGRIIWKYGEERFYKKIAHGIVYFRNSHGPINTTKELADLIRSIVSGQRSDALNRHAHVATKTFQAIRIFVNNELNELYNGISQVYELLKPGGRLAVISFHSLEDRIVKSHFHEISFPNEDNDFLKSRHVDKKAFMQFKMNETFETLDDFSQQIKKKWTPLNSKKIIVPTDEEISLNPRSRSAKLRVAVKN